MRNCTIPHPHNESGEEIAKHNQYMLSGLEEPILYGGHRQRNINYRRECDIYESGSSVIVVLRKAYSRRDRFINEVIVKLGFETK